jgi:hypothetical protein
MSNQRPFWMYGDSQQKPPREPTKPYTPIPAAQERHYTTHPNVIAGITILACFALFNLFFWIAFGFILGINPPDPVVIGSGFDRIELSPTWADALTGGRILLATVLGIIGTVITWNLVRDAYK